MAKEIKIAGKMRSATTEGILADASQIQQTEGQSVEQAINDLNSQTMEFSKDITNLNKNAGIDEYEEFSTIKEYAAGTTVLKDGLLYTFITDHAAGAWNPDEVEDTNLKNIIGDNIKDSHIDLCLNELGVINLLDLAQWDINKYWYIADSKSDFKGYKCSEIDISTYIGKYINIKLGNKLSNLNFCFVVNADETSAKLSDIAKLIYDSDTYEFKVSENNKYLRVSYNIDDVVNPVLLVHNFTSVKKLSYDNNFIKDAVYFFHKTVEAVSRSFKIIETSELDVSKLTETSEVRITLNYPHKLKIINNSGGLIGYTSELDETTVFKLDKSLINDDFAVYVENAVIGDIINIKISNGDIYEKFKEIDNNENEIRGNIKELNLLDKKAGKIDYDIIADFINTEATKDITFSFDNSNGTFSFSGEKDKSYNSACYFELVNGKENTEITITDISGYAIFARMGDVLLIINIAAKVIRGIDMRKGNIVDSEDYNIINDNNISKGSRDTTVRFLRISDKDINVFYNNELAYTIEINSNFNLCLGAVCNTTVSLWDVKILGYKFNGESLSTTVNSNSIETDHELTSSYLLSLDNELKKIPFSKLLISLFPYKGKKIYLFGDSIFSSSYTWNKEALEGLTLAEVYNAGFPGANAQLLARDNAFERLTSYDPDLIIALIGANNVGDKGSIGTFSDSSQLAKLGESVVTESDISKDFFTDGAYQSEGSFIGAISHIIRKIKYLYYNFRDKANINANLIKKDGSEEAIFTGTEKECYEHAVTNSINFNEYIIKPTDSEDIKTKKLNSVKKPQLIMCTPIAQQKASGINSSNKKENLERKRLAIIECCEKYNIPMIDLSNEFIIDWSKEPFYPGSNYSSTNATDNQGLYTMDGVHPNRYGYSLMMSIINNHIKNIFNPAFNFLNN